MKLFFPTLQSNDRLKQQFGQRVINGTIAHAYVIQGIGGTGKNYFAHLLSAAVCCHNKDADNIPLPCGECEACRKVMADGTPDIHNITRGDDATIGIDSIRFIKEDMYLSPTEQDVKIYIIHEAEKMTRQAQNALLIALEEPPPNVLIFLLCNNVTSLLPTVRSRVQSIRMSLFSNEQMHCFLQRNPSALVLSKNNPEQYQNIITIAAGSPGMALDLLHYKNMATVSESRTILLDILSCINTRTTFLKLHDALSKLPTKRADLIDELSRFTLVLRDLILLKRNETAPLLFFSNRDEAIEKSAGFSLRCLYNVYDAIHKSIKQLEKNMNVNAIMSALTFTILRAPTQTIQKSDRILK